MTNNTWLANVYLPTPEGEIFNPTNPPSDAYKIVVSSTIGASVSMIFVLARFYTRIIVVKSLGVDDFLTLCAWFCGLALCVMSCIETRHGIGVNMWNVSLLKLDRWLKARIISRFAIIMLIFQLQIQMGLVAAYLCALMFAKIAMCTFFLRLSPLRQFKWKVYAVALFIVGYSMAGLLSSILGCRPVSGSWSILTQANPDTKCLNALALYAFLSGVNILADILLFLLPMPTILLLQMPQKQRYGVIVIFSINLIATILSCARIPAVITLARTSDTTYHMVDWLVWSNLEVHVSIIGGCVPALNQLFRRFFPKSMGYPLEHMGVVTGAPRRSTYPEMTVIRTKMASNDDDDDDDESVELDQFDEFGDAGIEGPGGLGARHAGDLFSYRDRVERAQTETHITAAPVNDNDSDDVMINGRRRTSATGVLVTTTVEIKTKQIGLKRMLGK